MAETAAFGLTVTRSVTCTVGTTRSTLVRVLRDNGFAIESEHTTLVQARRGSMVSGTVLPEKAPVKVVVRLTPDGPACRVETRIEDRLRAAIGRGSGLENLFAEVFNDVVTRLDAALAKLDPAAAAGFEQTRLETTESGLLGRASASIGDVARSAMGAADRRLQGVKEVTPQRWGAVQVLDVRIDDDRILIGRDEMDELLDVAALIGAQPGDLPPKLVQHLERLAAGIESSLESGHAVPVLTLVSGDRPALDFLRQQSAVRESLPERRLMVCRDCRLEKVVNEDYQRLTERNRRINEMFVRFGPLSPATLLRQVFRHQVNMPDFVCPRCQGLSADPFIVTYCPKCGTQHKDGALKACACGFDFRAEGARRLAERPPVEIPTALPPAQPAPPPSSDQVAPADQIAPADQVAPADRVAPADQVAPADHVVPAPGGMSAIPANDSPVPESAPRPPVPAALAATATASPDARAEAYPTSPTSSAPSAPAGPSAGPFNPQPGPFNPQQPVPLPLPQPTAPPVPQPTTPPGWYPDPWRQAGLRYWDGVRWTGHVHGAPHR